MPLLFFFFFLLLLLFILLLFLLLLLLILLYFRHKAFDSTDKGFAGSKRDSNLCNGLREGQ